MRWHGLLQVVALDIFAQQQVFDWEQHANTTTDDTWCQLDYDFSPMEGWSLLRHVSLGCFSIPSFPVTFVKYVNSSVTEPSHLEGFHCCEYCASLKQRRLTTSSQAYFNFPTCYCGDAAELDSLVEVHAAFEECFDPLWKAFREYDFHTLTQAIYDVPRRVMYQQVSVFVPTTLDSSGLRHYLHAINAMEQEPAFHRTQLLERRTFNVAWDFAHTDMVGLSFDDGGLLELTFVHYNTSTGMLVSEHRYEPLEQDLLAHIPVDKRQILNGLGCAGCALGSTFGDGLATVDILYGTYWFAIPMIQDGTSYEIAHALVAYDLERMVLKGVWMTNRSLLSLQIDGLQHVLYGTSSNSTSQRFEFMELCRSIATTTLYPVEYDVECDIQPVIDLGENMTSSYLQSVAMDHKMNKTYMMYMSSTSSRPLLLEYDLITDETTQWNDDVLNKTTMFTSLVQTTPKLIFALDSPDFEYAKFSPDGERIEVLFTRDSLRGAIPFDVNGDEIPEGWDEADKLEYSKCERFFDDFTLKYIGSDSMCEWHSDKELVVSLTLLSDCYLTDMVRIRKSVLWAGEPTESGMFVFSMPSNDFTLLLPPDDIPYPEVYINSVEKVDACTEYTLDGTGTITDDYKVHYVWSLNSTDPGMSESHRRALGNIILAQRPTDTTKLEAAILVIPANIMQEGVTYVFSLLVTSYWNSTFWTVEYKDAFISDIPVPPIKLYGPAIIEAELGKGFSIASSAKETLCAPASDRMSYVWSGCLVPEDVLAKDVACERDWNSSSFDIAKISGRDTRSLYFEPFALIGPVGRVYKITLLVTLLDDQNMPTLSNNSVSMMVKSVLGPLVVGFRSGTSFTSFRGNTLVIDGSVANDPHDPQKDVRAGLQYTFSCAKVDPAEVPQQERDCFAQPTDASYFILEGQRNATVECVFRVDAAGIHTFQFQGKAYLSPDWTSPELATLPWCVSDDKLFLKPNALNATVWEYNFTLTVQKQVDALSREGKANMIVRVTSVEGPEVYIQAEAKPFFTPWEPLQLEAMVTNASPGTILQYAWRFFTWQQNPAWDRMQAMREKENYHVAPFYWSDMSLGFPAELGTLPGSTYVVNENVLQPGNRYKVVVNVTDDLRVASPMGTAQYFLTLVGAPPHSGGMTIDPSDGYAFETPFKITISGWKSDDMPLNYRVSIHTDPTSPFQDEWFLSSMYSPQHFMERVFLPSGAEQKVRVVAYIKTPFGAVSNYSVDVWVRPPKNATQAQARMLDRIGKQDAETQLDSIRMVMRLKPDLTVVDNLVDTMRANLGNLPKVPGALQAQAQVLSEVLDLGKQDDKVVTYVDDLLQMSVVNSYIGGELTSGRSTKSSLTGSLAGAMSGIVIDSSYQRRLQSGRRLASVVQRSPTERLAHIMRVRRMLVRVFRESLPNILSGSQPTAITTKNFNLFFAKAPTLVNSSPYAQEPAMHIPPAIAATGRIYTYMYLNFNEWPYTDIVQIPHGTVLGDEVSDTAWPYNLNRNGIDPFRHRRVPKQTAGPLWGSRLWRSTSVIIGDEHGREMHTTWNTALTASNVSAYFHTIVPVWPLSTFQSSVGDLAASCFALNVTSAGVGLISTGLVMDQGICASERLYQDYMYLADDLPKSLGYMELFAHELVRDYIDTYGTATLASTCGLLWVLACFFACGGTFLDRHQRDRHFSDEPPLIADCVSISRKWWHTFRNVVARDHVFGAFWAKKPHRHISREERSSLLLAASLVLLALSTGFHWNASFCSGRDSAGGVLRDFCSMPFDTLLFIATGMLAAVCAFPLVSLLQVMLIFRPRMRQATISPPPPAMSISALETKVNALPRSSKQQLARAAPDPPCRRAPPLLDTRPPPNLHMLETVRDAASAFAKPPQRFDAAPRPPRLPPHFAQSLKIPTLPPLSTELPDAGPITPPRPINTGSAVPKPPGATPPPHATLSPFLRSRGHPSPPSDAMLREAPQLPGVPMLPIACQSCAIADSERDKPPRPQYSGQEASQPSGYHQTIQKRSERLQRLREQSSSSLKIAQPCDSDSAPPPPPPRRGQGRPPISPPAGPVLHLLAYTESHLATHGSAAPTSHGFSQQDAAAEALSPHALFEGSHALPPPPDPPRNLSRPAFLPPPVEPLQQQLRALRTGGQPRTPSAASSAPSPSGFPGDSFLLPLSPSAARRLGSRPPVGPPALPPPLPRRIELQPPDLGEHFPPPPRKQQAQAARFPKAPRPNAGSSSRISIPALYILAPAQDERDIPILPPRRIARAAPAPPRAPPPGDALALSKRAGSTHAERPSGAVAHTQQRVSGTEPQPQSPSQPILALPKPPSCAPPASTQRLARDAFDQYTQRRQMLESTRRYETTQAPPVPDFIIALCRAMVYFVILWVCAGSSFIIITFGTPLRARQLAHTHYSFAVALAFFFGVCDTVKCAVSTLVLLSREESGRRMAIKKARRIRMNLKSQALEENVRGKWYQGVSKEKRVLAICSLKKS